MKLHFSKVMFLLRVLFVFSAAEAFRNMTIPNFETLYGTNLIIEDEMSRLTDCSTFSLVFLRNTKDIASRWEDTHKLLSKNGRYFVCEFNFDYYGAEIEENIRLNEFKINEWFCEVEHFLVCDGTSECLADECECGRINGANFTDIFYCTDSFGCLTFDKLCNGVHDCKDGSDERYCADSLHMDCPGLGNIPISISYIDYCLNDNGKSIIKGICTKPVEEVNCSQVLEEYYRLVKNKNPLSSCLQNSKVVENFIASGLDIADDFLSNYCKTNCSQTDGFIKDGWIRFCDFILTGPQSGHSLYSQGTFFFVFNCDKIPYSGVSTLLEGLCDGNVDCSNGADELWCPGRFYCSPNESSESIDSSKVCDDVNDCLNGWDECQSCDLGFLSSTQYLIHSNVVFILTIVGGLAITVTNIVVGNKCFKSAPVSRVGAIDRIIRLQVFFYDGLMGVYMCLIVVATVILRTYGDYCLLQRTWRSSYYCSTLGVIFSVSSHGSLFTIVFMSVVRCMVCHGREFDISKLYVVVVSVVMLILNIFSAILPLLPMLAIQNIFRTDIFLTNIHDNPFINSNPLNLSELRKLHRDMFYEEENIYTALRNLNNITSNHKMFDTVEIGYYGHTSQCIHNIFNAQESFETYKITYCAILGAALTFLTVSYLMIVRFDREARAAVDCTGGVVCRGADQNVNNPSSCLAIKASLIILTQLSSWISLLFALIYFKYIAQKAAPSLTFELFALVIIPLNSLLNPIFYSGLYKKLSNFAWYSWGKFVNKINPVATLPVERDNAKVSNEEKQSQEKSSQIQSDISAKGADRF